MPLSRPVSSADLRIDNGSLPPAPSPSGHHAETASGRVALKIGLERQCYVAGQQIRGVLEVHAKSKGLALGDIGIEFGGTEELRTRDHTSTRRLLNTRIDFQGNGLPPSNAVVPNSRPVQAGFYPALPGRTRFPFVFDIPAEAPSSSALGSNATKRFELRAFASSFSDANVDIRTEKVEVKVVERWADWKEGPWQLGAEKRAAEKLAVGGDGLLEMSVSIGRGDEAEKPARLFWRGDADLELDGKGTIEIVANVRNLTKRHVTGFKVSLLRRLRILYPEDARPLVEPPIVTDTVASERFQGIDFDVRAECERSLVLPMHVPKDESWTVRRGSLFELDLVVRVEAECGFLQKPLAVDLPIWIAHPLSLPNSAHRFAANERARLAPIPLASPPESGPAPNFTPASLYVAPSPAPSTISTYLPLPGTPQPVSYAGSYAGSSVSMVSSVSSPAGWPPQSPAPYFPPPPAAPAELYDPLSTAWAAPQSSPVHAHYPLGGGSGVQLPPTQHYAYGTPQPSIDYSASLPQAYSPAPQLSAPSTVPSPRANAWAPSASTVNPPQLTSSMTSPSLYGLSQYSPPLPCPSPMPAQRPLPSTTPSTPPPLGGPRSRTPRRTPPPPSPSTAYRPSPSTSPAPVELAEPARPAPALEVPASLETIGEDGESQAGTARSAALPSGAADELRKIPAEDGEESRQNVRPSVGSRRTSAQNLEDMVDDEERARQAAVSSGSTGVIPGPVADSALTATPRGRLRAQDIFSMAAGDATDTSSIAAPANPSDSGRHASPSPPKREVGGLAALQARLARSTSSAPGRELPAASAGSRSPSPTKTLLDVVPSPGPESRRARSISRASRYQQSATLATQEDPREVVQRIRAQSGLSPINLADLRQLSLFDVSSSGPSANSSPSNDSHCAVNAVALEETRSAARLPLPSPHQALPSPEHLETVGDRVSIQAGAVGSSATTRRMSQDVQEVSRSGVSATSADPPRRPVFSSQPSTPAAPSPTTDAKPARPSPWSSRAASPWSPRATVRPSSSPVSVLVPRDSTLSRAPSSPIADASFDSTGRKVVNARELKDLKQIAVERVAGWISGTEDAGDAPYVGPVDQSSPPLVRPDTDSPATSAALPTADSPQPAIFRRSLATGSRSMEPPTPTQRLAIETRAALRESQRIRPVSMSAASSVQKGLNSYLAALEQDASFERGEQTHKSVKVAQPGKVTSVASIWAERIQHSDLDASVRAPSGHKSTKSLSALPQRHSENAPTSSRTFDTTGDAPTTRTRPASLYGNTDSVRSMSTSTPPRGAEGNSPASSPRKAGARVNDLLTRYQQQIT